MRFNIEHAQYTARGATLRASLGPLAGFVIGYCCGFRPMMELAGQKEGQLHSEWVANVPNPARWGRKNRMGSAHMWRMHDENMLRRFADGQGSTSTWLLLWPHNQSPCDVSTGQQRANTVCRDAEYNSCFLPEGTRVNKKNSRAVN